jgi:RND family efflux transporter MFP subunit
MRSPSIVLLLLLAEIAAAEIPVTARPLADLVIHPERSAPASVESVNNADLSSEITARVLTIPVRVGEVVNAGEILVQLDCRDYQSRLAAQQATLVQFQSQKALAESQLDRARNLKRERNISDEEVDRRDTELAALEAQIKAQTETIRQAETNVERCTVRAPYRAAVTARLTDVGTLANPGSALLRLVQLDQLEVSARVRPDEVEEGAAAERLEFVYLDRRYPLKVVRVVPVVDPATRTVEIRLEFVAEEAPSGASGRLIWHSAGDYLPAELPVRRGGTLGVFVLTDGEAAFHPLEGALEGQPARVGLPADSMIIVEGRQRLQDGDAVRVGEHATSD